MALLHKPAFTKAKATGKTDTTRTITVGVHLRRRPGHDPVPTFDDYLNGPPRVRMPEHEFARRFGADPNDVTAVKKHFSQFGFASVTHHMARRRVYLTGTVEQFNTAFQVELYDYEMPSHSGMTHKFYSHHGQGPYVPDHLGRMIMRLHNLHQQNPMMPHLVRPSPDKVQPPVYPGGGGTVTPAILSQIYKFPANYSGAGQVIAVQFQLASGPPANQIDMVNGCKYYGITPVPTPIWISADGSLPTAQGAATGWQEENTLDVQMCAYFAPNATIVTLAISNTDDFYTRIAHPDPGDPIFTIGSTSAGFSEDLIITGPADQIEADGSLFDDVYEDCAIQGVTQCNSSGDWGNSAAMPWLTAQGTAPPPIVDCVYPATDPYILGVGGTIIGASSGTFSASNFIEFMLGNAAGPGLTGTAASGGGVSIIYPLPSYQLGVGIPPALHVPPGSFGTAGRGYPEISAMMDTEMYITFDTLQAVGGTSMSCPIVASMLACINNSLGWNVGYINPILYSLNGNTSIIRRASPGGPPDNAVYAFDGVSSFVKNSPAYPTSTTMWACSTGLGILQAQPFITYMRSIKGAAQLSGISLSNQTIPPSASFGTVVGSVSVTTSSGPFDGAVAIGGPNKSSFYMDGNNVIVVDTPPAQASYSITLSAIQSGAASSPLTKSFVLTTTTQQTGPPPMTIPVITPGNGSFVALGGTWTVTTAGLMAFTGAGGPGTSSGVTQATFINGAVWQFNGTNWYGTTTPGSYPLGGTTTPPWSVPVTGLTAGTSYDFEITASNAGGTGPASSPIVTTSTLTSNGTGIFTTNGRNIIGPNGNVYQPRGMNIWGDAGQDLSNVYNLVSTQAPGTNFVRTYYDDSNDFTSNQTAINHLTSQGIVVCICDNSFHNEALGNGNPDQTTFVNRAAGIARLFPSPLVWIEGENEPAGNQPTANGQMMAALYTAVRAVDAHKIIVFNGADDGNRAEVLPSSIFSSMTNVVWSQHFYNWESGPASDQPTIQAAYQGDLNNIMSFFNGPIMCGEYGEATGQATPPTGVNGDNGGATLLQVVHNFVTSGAICGDCYFQWYSGGVPGTYVTLSLFTSLTGGVPLGNLTNTCQVGNNSSSGCGAVALQWIASSQGTANT